MRVLFFFVLLLFTVSADAYVAKGRYTSVVKNLHPCELKIAEEQRRIIEGVDGDAFAQISRRQSFDKRHYLFGFWSVNTRECFVRDLFQVKGISIHTDIPAWISDRLEHLQQKGDIVDYRYNPDLPYSEVWVR